MDFKRINEASKNAHAIYEARADEEVFTKAIRARNCNLESLRFLIKIFMRNKKIDSSSAENVVTINEFYITDYADFLDELHKMRRSELEKLVVALNACEDK